jgi:hypothetical protein
MDIGRIVREVEVLPATQPDTAPLVEPERETQPEPVPAEPG